MTIEIHNAELERLLEERLETGGFSSVEEMLLEALRRKDEHSGPGELSESLVSFFRRSPLVGLELEFERDRDPGRDISL